MIFIRRKWAQKPRQWGPPSAVRAAVRDWFERRGIACPTIYTALQEQSGTSVVNYGSGGLLTAVNPTWTGDGINCRTADGRIEIADHADIDGLWTGAAGTLFFVGDFPSSYSYYYPFSFGWTSMRIGLRFVPPSHDGLFATGAAANATFDSGDFSGASAMAFVADAYTPYLYRDGGEAVSWESNSIDTAAEWPGGTYSSTDARFLLSRHDTDYQWPEARMICIIPQALAADQIAALYADPYGAIQPRSFPLYFFGKSVSTGFVPAWAANATVTIPPIGAGHV